MFHFYICLFLYQHHTVLIMKIYDILVWPVSVREFYINEVTFDQILKDV